MTQYEPIFDPTKVDPFVRPMKWQVEANLIDQIAERETWLEAMKLAGNEIVMVMPGVNATHYEARPLRPDDV